MGGASSSAIVKQTDNNVIINKQKIDILQEQLNNITAQTIINNAKKCSQNANLFQNIKISNIKTKGPFKITDLKQFQDSHISMDCLQQDATVVEVENNLAGKILAELNNMNNSEALSKMAASAESSSQASGLFAPSSASKSRIENSHLFSNETNVSKDIKNVVMNSIMQSFTKNTLQECIANNILNQNIDITNISAEDGVDISFIEQKQISSVLSKCKQINDDISQAISSVENALGIQSEDVSSTKTITTIEGEAKSTATSKGLDLGMIFAIVIIFLFVGGIIYFKFFL